MKKVFMIYENFLDSKGEDITIGGIQTYIQHLCLLLKKGNYEPIIIQMSDIDFEKIYGDIKVIGVNISRIKKTIKRYKLLYKRCENLGNIENDILIFVSDHMCVKNKFKNSIAIQHGITWDIPNLNLKHSKFEISDFIKKSIKSYRIISRLNNVNKIVAVDYNFLNWYRTKVSFKSNHIKVIPNFTFVPELNEKKMKYNVNIIFARRFQEHRGSKLFGDVIKEIIKIRPNVNVTFAGDGPFKEYLVNLFKNEERVKFIKYEAEQSLEIHQLHDIAVIPTIGSEGTSFSLLESMASGCAIIASNVGGITNILIDGYNGIMIAPRYEELKESLIKLIDDKQFRERLSLNAYNVVKHGFNYEVWSENWKKVLEK